MGSVNATSCSKYYYQLYLAIIYYVQQCLIKTCFTFMKDASWMQFTLHGPRLLHLYIYIDLDLDIYVYIRLLSVSLYLSRY